MVGRTMAEAAARELISSGFAAISRHKWRNKRRLTWLQIVFLKSN